MKKSKGVIAVDNGGHSTCVAMANGIETFPSVKGLYGDRRLTDVSGRYDFVVDYKGEKYVMGTLAKYDCKYPLQMHTRSKQNLFYDLSTLVAIHQYGYQENYVITSVPVKMHTDDEKFGIAERLIGEHTIAVNGYTKTFIIMDVKVAPEAAVAFWSHELEGLTRYIDLGSRTIGYATTLFEEGDVRFIDTESGTLFNKGLEALGDDYNQKGLADYICGKLLSVWDQGDTICLLGGGALDNVLVECIRHYFPNTSVVDDPVNVNAKSMYELGRITYDMA